MERERNLADSVQIPVTKSSQSASIQNPVSNQSSGRTLKSNSLTSSTNVIEKQEPIPAEPTQNRLTSIFKKKKGKAPPAPASRVSPQHQPRLNPFNDEPEEEASQINSRNPFEDPNPFTQPESNPFENGPSNPFEEIVNSPKTPEDPNPFANMNGLVEHEIHSQETQKEDLNFQVSCLQIMHVKVMS